MFLSFFLPSLPISIWKLHLGLGQMIPKILCGFGQSGLIALPPPGGPSVDLASGIHVTHCRWAANPAQLLFWHKARSTPALGHPLLDCVEVVVVEGAFPDLANLGNRFWESVQRLKTGQWTGTGDGGRGTGDWGQGTSRHYFSYVTLHQYCR